MKKIVAITIGIFTLIILVLLIVVNRSAKKQAAPSTSVSGSVATQAIPQLPPGTEIANIDQNNISGSIQENIEKSQASSQAPAEVQFKESENKPTATLDQFQASTNIKISPNILDGMRQNEYSVFSCPSSSASSSGTGIILRFKAGTTAAYYANLYSQTDKNLTSWESSMFSDLSALLFPGKKISQNPVFKSTKYTTENGAATIDIRYGETESNSGEKISIYYAVYSENIYIFNSSKCLGAALDKYEPVLEP